MAGQTKDLTSLYSELNRFGQAEEFEKAIKSANRSKLFAGVRHKCLVSLVVQNI